MSFRLTCLTAAILYLALALILAFIPQIVYWLFSLTQNELGDFLARRASALFLGLALLCFLTHRSELPETRNVVSLVVGVTMSTLVFFGIYEFARGYAGIGILIAIAIEIALAVSFLKLWLQAKEERKQFSNT